VCGMEHSGAVRRSAAGTKSGGGPAKSLRVHGWGAGGERDGAREKNIGKRLGAVATKS
jgi:hypothetical protein